MIRLLLLPLLLAPLCVRAQTVAPQLLPGEGGGRITRTETYQGRSLSGYMNGGAELYHEYGFVALSVQSVSVAGAGDLTVEIFRMSAPRAALGIYSVSRHGCADTDSSLFTVCEGAYQVQGTARENYIRIQSGTDTPAARKARRALFSALARRLGQEKLMLSPYFRKASDVILMNGPLGVQNGMPELEDVLDGIEGYAVQAVWLDSMGDGYDLLAEVTFSSDDSMKAFAGRSCDTVECTGVAEFSAHKGWWMLRCPGNVVRILKGSVDRDRAARVLMDGPSGR